MSGYGLPQGLLALARRLAPGEDRAWLEEMAHELPFVEGTSTRLRWGLGALRLALTLRFAGSKKRTVTYASLTAALTVVMVAALFLVPRYAIPTEGTMEAVPVPEAAAPSAPSADVDTYAGAGATEEAETSAAETVESEPPLILEEPLAQSEDASEPAPMLSTAPADAPLPASPAAVPSQTQLTTPAEARVSGASDAPPTPITGEQIMLTITENARLEVSSVTPQGNEVLVNRAVEPGETFQFTSPFELRTTNAGGVHVLADGRDLGALGRSGEAQTRRFVPEP